MNSLTHFLRHLYQDEAGMVVSAEAVTVGTIGVLTAVVGANAIGSAVDSELREAALAIRSLDQSYIYAGHRGCGAWTAGSYYIQPSVEQSAAELYPDSEPELRAIQKRIDDERKAFAQPPGQIRKPAEAKPAAPTPTPIQETQPNPEPKPNQIPVPEKKPDNSDPK